MDSKIEFIISYNIAKVNRLSPFSLQMRSYCRFSVLQETPAADAQHKKDRGAVF